MIEKGFDDDASGLREGRRLMAAIARTLISDVSAVIPDEPAAALDPLAEYGIYRSFNDVIGSKTAVFISRKLASCRFCSRILVFAEGRICQDGPHTELIESGGLYRTMFETQAQNYRLS